MHFYVLFTSITIEEVWDFAHGVLSLQFFLLLGEHIPDLYSALAHAFLV